MASLDYRNLWIQKDASTGKWIRPAGPADSKQPWVFVAKSMIPLIPLGLFAGSDFKKGDVITRVELVQGEDGKPMRITTPKEIRKYQQESLDYPTYISVKVNRGKMIIPMVQIPSDKIGGGSFARNGGPRVITNSALHIVEEEYYLRAIKSIKSNDEILYKYQTEYKKYRKDIQISEGKPGLPIFPISLCADADANDPDEAEDKDQETVREEGGEMVSGLEIEEEVSRQSLAEIRQEVDPTLQILIGVVEKKGTLDFKGKDQKERIRNMGLIYQWYTLKSAYDSVIAKANGSLFHQFQNLTRKYEVVVPSTRGPPRVSMEKKAGDLDEADRAFVRGTQQKMDNEWRKFLEALQKLQKKIDPKDEKRNVDQHGDDDDNDNEEDDEEEEEEDETKTDKQNDIFGFSDVNIHNWMEKIFQTEKGEDDTFDDFTKKRFHAKEIDFAIPKRMKEWTDKDKKRIQLRKMKTDLLLLISDAHESSATGKVEMSERLWKEAGFDQKTFALMMKDKIQRADVSYHLNLDLSLAERKILQDAIRTTVPKLPKPLKKTALGKKHTNNLADRTNIDVDTIEYLFGLDQTLKCTFDSDFAKEIKDLLKKEKPRN